MCETRTRVSVVIPCFNQGAFLDDAVSSCLEAYQGPLEIIIVDDGSTDPQTGRYLAALSVPPRAHLEILRQPNGGLAKARNVGLARAAGDYVQLLDSDDLLVRNKLEHQLRHFELDPRLDVSVSDYYLADESRTEFTRQPSSIAPFALSLEDFLFHWERGFCVPIHTALFRRSLFTDPSPFAEDQRAKEDWLFWIKLKQRGFRVAYLPLRLCVYRLHASNMTRSSGLMGLEWLKAVSKIEASLGGSHPEFKRRSLAWYLDWYATRARSEDRPDVDRAPPPPSGAVIPDPVPAPAGGALVAPATRSAATSISVVIPVFNHARYLRRCIRSARDQTAPPGEIICVDDGSTDPAVRPILEELAASIPELRVQFLEENRGIAHAQNVGIEMARGKFIAFLDCDDFLAPGALEVAARCMVADPDVDYFFTDRYDIDSEDRLQRHAVYGGYPDRPDLDRASHRENLLDTMIASHLKVIRRSSILEVGGFDARASGVQDWDLALKIAEHGTLQYIPEPLYFHRIHLRSVTQGQRALMFRLTNEVRRRHQGIRARKVAERFPEADALEDVAAFLSRPCTEGRDRGAFRWDAERRAWRHEKRGTVIVREQRAPRDAFQLWSESQATLFVLEPGALATTLAFLREFNSYFDLVVCADEAQWATLHRYMWDGRALRLFDELQTFRQGETAGSLRECTD